LLASGSVAAVLILLEEARLAGPQVLTVIGQVTIADVVTILAIPLVLQSGRAGSALYRKGWVHRLRKRSKRRRWALDLRIRWATT
jgi:hypothetical protein